MEGLSDPIIVFIYIYEHNLLYLLKKFIIQNYGNFTYEFY